MEDDFKIGWYVGPTESDGALSSPEPIYHWGLAGTAKCCCLPAKCHMPDAVIVTLSGFWSEFGYVRSGQYFSAHKGIPVDGYPEGCGPYYVDCRDHTVYMWNAGRADGYLDITWFPARDGGSPGDAQLCVVNPWMLEYFPGMDGDPPAPLTEDPIYVNHTATEAAVYHPSCGGTHHYLCEWDIFWRAVGLSNSYYFSQEVWDQAMDGWTVRLPSCVYSFTDYYSPICHNICATAGDLQGQSTVLRRRYGTQQPVLKPVITRQRTPVDGEEFVQAQLLYDVYFRPFQESWASDEGWDGRYSRFSVDYVCNPRSHPLSGNPPAPDPFVYKCGSPPGIVQPKLRAAAHAGGGSAEIEFTIAPVAGSGFSPRDTMWQVDSVSIKTPGTGAEVDDIFRIDFWESPMRGGEYRDSETPQEVVVTSVGDNGEVTGVAIKDDTTLMRPVYYGRFLCHPNGVALRGTGYSEGDQIVWEVVDQLPEIGAAQATTYSPARAVVTEVDDNGGILDWYMPNSRHGDGDDEHTFNYDCVPQIKQPNGECLGSRTDPGMKGAECVPPPAGPTCTSSLEAVDCRGLYSDVINSERCVISYLGYVGFRASAQHEANTTSECGGAYGCTLRACSCGPNTACTQNYCGINTIPVMFDIYPIETRLKVDITAPGDVSLVKSVAAVMVNVTAGTSPGDPLSPPASAEEVPFGDDFIIYPEAEQELEEGRTDPVEFNVSIDTTRAGSGWKASATVSVTHGTINTGGESPQGKTVTASGTVAEVNAVISGIEYWPPASGVGQDSFIVTVEITPPGYDQPLTAVYRASELLNRCSSPGLERAYGSNICGDEMLLDYWIGALYSYIKGFEYPDSRPLGGVSEYEMISRGAGYASWDHENEEWKAQSNLKVFVDSAWDEMRKDIKRIYGSAYDYFAHAVAVPDLDVSSSTFGQIMEVVPDRENYETPEGAFYCIHEYDNLWLGRVTWDFYYDMFMANGTYITSAGFPEIIHKDGYFFPATHRCDEPNLTCFGESLSSQCVDKTQPCRPLTNDYLWSFEYCPQDLFKAYEMMMRKDGLARPNTPRLMGKEIGESEFVPLTGVFMPPDYTQEYTYSKCTNGWTQLDRPDIQYSPCDDICMYGFGSWCEHPQPAVTHDSVCWFNERGTQQSWPWFPDGYIGLNPYSLYLDFGVGPITFTITPIPGDNGDERERSVY